MSDPQPPCSVCGNPAELICTNDRKDAALRCRAHGDDPIPPGSVLLSDPLADALLRAGAALAAKTPLTASSSSPAAPPPAPESGGPRRV